MSNQVKAEKTTRKITFLGSSDLLLELIKFAYESTKYEQVLVGYAPRHAVETMPNNLTYEENLYELKKKYKNIRIYKLDNLDEPQYSDLCESELQVSIGSAWIYRQRHIDMAPLLVHPHCTDLPRYRGGASISWMIMSKYRKAAITLFKINSGIDTGDLLIKQDFEYPESFTKPIEFINYVNQLTLSTLTKFIEDFCETGRFISGTPQNESISTYFPRLSSEVNSWINWNWSAEEVVSFINAFSDPFSGAMSRLNSADSLIIKIADASIHKEDGSFHPFKNGLIYRIEGTTLFVICAPYSIKITDFFDSNKSKAASKVKVGDRFFSLSTDIDKSMATRVFFNPS